MTTSLQSQDKNNKPTLASTAVATPWWRWGSTSIRNLYKIGLLTPKGARCVTKSLYQHGANLMVLLEFASQMAPHRATFNQQYTYRQCYELALSLSGYLNDELQRNAYRSALDEPSPNRHSTSQRHPAFKLSSIKTRLNRYALTGTTKPKTKIALLCSNHTSGILALFAAARLGGDITLLNTDMSHSQIAHILAQQPYDMLICDDKFADINLLIDSSLASAPKSTATAAPIIISCTTLQQFFASNAKGLTASQKSNPYLTSAPQLPRQSSGKINVLTGGTSGRIKFADREPSPFAMLIPFLALLNDVELAKYQSVYIATPFYHGYGLAALLISVLLSGRIFISDTFATAKISQLVYQNQIETLILVPTLLKRLLDYDQLNQHNYNLCKGKQAEDNTAHNHSDNCHYEPTFRSVQRIISGGAKLDAHLAKQTLAHTGDTLFNLYGTSEAGFGVMATPADLHRYPDSIGKAIRGVRLQILPIEQTLGSQAKHAKQDPSDPDIGTGIGVLSLGTAWSMDNKPTEAKPLRRSGPSYISTGDLAYQNAESYLFLKGRADDMIVSGGENVYPSDIENALNQHPQVDQVAVIAVDNEEFGKRLIAFVRLNINNEFEPSVYANEGQLPNTLISAEQLMKWLKPKLARYQMPRQIVLLDELPMTKTGKVSHVQLRALLLRD